MIRFACHRAPVASFVRDMRAFLAGSNAAKRNESLLVESPLVSWMSSRNFGYGKSGIFDCQT